MVQFMVIKAYTDQGLFDPRRIAKALLTTSEDLARSTGLGKDAMLRDARVRNPKTQTQLRELVEVLNKVEGRFGSALIAYAWFRSQPLPGFAGQTAMNLVQNGRGSDVLEYIDAVDAGIFA